MQQGYWGQMKQMRKQLRERVNSMLGNPPTPFSRPPCRSPFPLQHVLPVGRGSGQFQFYHMIQQSDGIVRGLGMDIQENPNSFWAWASGSVFKPSNDLQVWGTDVSHLKDILWNSVACCVAPWDQHHKAPASRGGGTTFPTSSSNGVRSVRISLVDYVNYVELKVNETKERTLAICLQILRTAQAAQQCCWQSV